MTAGVFCSAVAVTSIPYWPLNAPTIAPGKPGGGDDVIEISPVQLPAFAPRARHPKTTLLPSLVVTDKPSSQSTGFEKDLPPTLLTVTLTISSPELSSSASDV